MATLSLNIPDELKKKLQDACKKNNVSMTAVLSTWMQDEMAGASLTPISQIAEQTPDRRIYPCTCLVCGHKWESIKERPRVCVRCKSYFWDDADKAAIRHKKNKARENREQANLHKSLMSVYLRMITNLDECITTEDIALQIGIDTAELTDYLRQNKPVSKEVIEKMERKYTSLLF